MDTKSQDSTEIREKDLCAEVANPSAGPSPPDLELKKRPLSSPFNLKPCPVQYGNEPPSDGSAIDQCEDLRRKRTRGEYKSIVNRIERFVDEALSSDEIPMVLKSVNMLGDSFDLSPLARNHLNYFPVVVEVASKFSKKNRYDEYLDLFRDACNELVLYSNSLLDQISLWGITDHQLENLAMQDCAEIFNRFVETLRRLGVEKNVKQHRCERLRDAKARYKNYRQYFDDLVTRYRRLVAVRLDLAYRNPSDAHTMDLISDHFDVFLKNRRSEQTIFSGLVGYIAKFEYGVDRGPHIHLIIFFDGDIRQDKAQHFAKCIGDYWVKITQDGGTYFNCHVNDPDYAKRGTLGVGSIHVEDEVKRRKFCDHVLPYLCKSDSFARPKGGRGFRSIRRGESRKKPVRS